MSPVSAQQRIEAVRRGYDAARQAMAQGAFGEPPVYLTSPYYQIGMGLAGLGILGLICYAAYSASPSYKPNKRLRKRRYRRNSSQKCVVRDCNNNAYSSIFCDGHMRWWPSVAGSLETQINKLDWIVGLQGIALEKWTGTKKEFDHAVREYKKYFAKRAALRKELSKVFEDFVSGSTGQVEQYKKPVLG